MTAVNRRLFLHLLLLSIYSGVSAQCPIATGSWPSTVRFEPAMPAAGQPVVMTLGPSYFVDVNSQTVSITAGQVIMTGIFADLTQIGVPPAPREIPVNLGTFAAGQYTVRIQLTTDNGLGCPEIDAALSISGAANQSVPTLGIGAMLGLLFGLVLVAGVFGRGAIRRHPSMQSH